jgi:hypothetical protein
LENNFKLSILINQLIFLNHLPVHFHLGDDTGENATTDGDLADKGALFVNVVSLASL